MKKLEMENFITQLHEEDNFNLRLGKILKRFYIYMVAVYMLLVVLNPFTPFDIYHRISGILFVLTFSWFAVLFSKIQKDFREVDYGEPTLQMLQKVVMRYKLPLKTFLGIIPPVIFAGSALLITSYGSNNHRGSSTGVWVTIAMYIAAVMVAVFAGILAWRIRHKPLHDFAREMLKDLQD